MPQPDGLQVIFTLEVTGPESGGEWESADLITAVAIAAGVPTSTVRLIPNSAVGARREAAGGWMRLRGRRQAVIRSLTFAVSRHICVFLPSLIPLFILAGISLNPKP